MTHQGLSRYDDSWPEFDNWHLEELLADYEMDELIEYLYKQDEEKYE